MRTTPEESALDDYAAAFRVIAPLVDYVGLNISSPNTPGLRRLQAPDALRPLVDGILALRKEMGLERQPLLVKLAPDLPFPELDAILEVLVACGVNGVIATNTTLDRGIISEMNRAKVEALGEGGRRAAEGEGREDQQEERGAYCRERESELARVSFAQRDSHHSSNKGRQSTEQADSPDR